MTTDNPSVPPVVANFAQRLAARLADVEAKVVDVEKAVAEHVKAFLGSSEGKAIVAEAAQSTVEVKSSDDQS